MHDVWRIACFLKTVFSITIFQQTFRNPTKNADGASQFRRHVFRVHVITQSISPFEMTMVVNLKMDVSRRKEFDPLAVCGFDLGTGKPVYVSTDIAMKTSALQICPPLTRSNSLSINYVKSIYRSIKVKLSLALIAGGTCVRR